MSNSKPLKILRDHDKLYLSEDRKLKPKEYFKFIATHADAHIKSLDQPRLLDIGCATGDFLYFLDSVYPQANLTGVEVSEELLERARTEVPNCEFKVGDVCDSDTLPATLFDAVFVVGVHSIFDDLDPWLSNVLSLVDRDRDGKLYVFGMFNPYDVDVLVKVRPSNSEKDGPWQPGWNCFSMASVGSFLEQQGVRDYRFHDFTIGIDVPKNPDDPLRSWSFKYEDGSRGIINGSRMLHDFKLLEVSV